MVAIAASFRDVLLVNVFIFLVSSDITLLPDFAMFAVSLARVFQSDA